MKSPHVTLEEEDGRVGGRWRKSPRRATGGIDPPWPLRTVEVEKETLKGGLRC
jgi:hypothetical protein